MAMVDTATSIPIKRRKLSRSNSESTRSSGLTEETAIIISDLEDDSRDVINQSSRREKMAEAGKMETRSFLPENKSQREKMPSEVELEDFFSTAEKQINKQFTDKYNFDVAKELPLEGRYDWVQIKP